MTSLAGLAVFTLLCAVAAGDDHTFDFYQESQYTPVLTYECYRTGVTLEPENAVNFTILWDGTEAGNDKAVATTWYALNGTMDQYTTGAFDYEYDEETSSIQIKSSDVEEHFLELIKPLNGLCYYLKLTITSQNNRVVYKLYDVDSACGNAAATLRLVDPQRKKRFIFSRDVPEPVYPCRKVQFCAP
ncbi:uncharacterized protein LOC144104986 [Amblyomma americanum]|uniref:Secreted protein n=1 Tax=Amblyomma americanum TaxID=6943 RepID=A0AAQ4DWD8_AMBAM